MENFIEIEMSLGYVIPANSVCVALQISEQFCPKARTRQLMIRWFRCRASFYPAQSHKSPLPKWPLSNFRGVATGVYGVGLYIYSPKISPSKPFMGRKSESDVRTVIEHEH